MCIMPWGSKGLTEPDINPLKGMDDFLEGVLDVSVKKSNFSIDPSWTSVVQILTIMNPRLLFFFSAFLAS